MEERENGEEDAGDDDNVVIHIKTNSKELLHVAFLNEESLWQWRYILGPHVDKAGLQNVTPLQFEID